MGKGRHHDEDWSEYQEYHASSDYDPARGSANNPALDTYLEEDNALTSSRNVSRKVFPFWRILTASTAGLVFVVLFAVLIGRSTPSREVAVNPPSPSSPQQVFPDTGAPPPEVSKLSAPPEAKQAKNLVSQLSPGIVLVLATKPASKQSTPNPSPASGTGFIIDRRGYVVTNTYFLGSGKQATVILHDGIRQTASVVATEPTLDIAILKMPNALPYQVCRLGNSNDVQVGDALHILGFPPGASPGSASTVNNGQISSFRHYKGERWFQIAPPLTQAHSGGPLVRVDSGVVVGMVTWKGGEGGSEPVTFVRPIKSIQSLLARYIK